MRYTVSWYDCKTGKTHRTKRHNSDTLLDAQRSIYASDSGIAEMVTSGNTEWEGPEHRGGKPGTWALYDPIADVQYVIREHSS